MFSETDRTGRQTEEGQNERQEQTDIRRPEKIQKTDDHRGTDH